MRLAQVWPVIRESPVEACPFEGGTYCGQELTNLRSLQPWFQVVQFRIAQPPPDLLQGTEPGGQAIHFGANCPPRLSNGSHWSGLSQ